MGQRRRLMVVAIYGLCCLIMGAAVYFFLLPGQREVRAFRAQFDRIEAGTSEAQVIALLGPPDRRSNEFALGQERGFEAAYARAARSSAESFLVWHKGVDLVFTIGVDANQKVCVKEFGGT